MTAPKGDVPAGARERLSIEQELEICDGSMGCPAFNHPPTCRFRQWQDRQVERLLEDREMGRYR